MWEFRDSKTYIECRKYWTERDLLFDRQLGLEVEAFSVCSLFGHYENHKLISKAILQFLHNTGLYVKIKFNIGPGGQKRV